MTKMRKHLHYRNEERTAGTVWGIYFRAACGTGHRKLFIFLQDKCIAKRYF